MERFSTVICLLVFAIGCVMVRGQSPAPPKQWVPLQVKVCPKPDNSWTSTILPCSFDSPTTAGNLGIVVAVYGCNYRDCNSFSDTQGNTWNLGLYAPTYNGIPLWYTTLKGGSETITFVPGRGGSVIIAEYPCPTAACLLDDAAYDWYDDESTPANGEVQDNEGWAGIHRLDSSFEPTITLKPIETHEPCELLISWALINGSPAKAGLGFTMRADDRGVLALEDSTTTVPGYYWASMSWLYNSSWVEGAATFKMGGCQ